MTLTDQKRAAITHRDTEAKNFDATIAFLIEQKKLSMEAHEKAISRIDEQITRHMEFIGQIA